MYNLPRHHPRQIERTLQPQAMTEYIDTETGEIIEIPRLPHATFTPQPVIVCHCSQRWPRRRSFTNKRCKQLIEHIGLVGVLGLVLVVMLEMGR